jgi:hypothetical protein
MGNDDDAGGKRDMPYVIALACIAASIRIIAASIMIALAVFWR